MYRKMCVLERIRKIWIFSGSTKDVIVLLCVGVVCMFSFSCYSLPAPFFSSEAVKKGASKTTIGILYGLFELFVFVLSPVFGKYLIVLGCKRVLLAGVLISGVSTMILGSLCYIEDKNIFIVSCFVVRVLEAVGAAACLTTSYTIAVKLFDQHVSSVMGVMEMCNGLGLMIGPAVGSGLYQVGGFELPFYTTGALLIISGCVCVYTMPEFKEDGHEPGSLMPLLRNPPIVITGLSVMVAASGIGFLEPTLSEHLKELKLSTTSAGGFFILLPLVYVVSAPVWGLINEKKDCGRQMMMTALFFAFLAFITLGPTPVIHNFHSSTVQLILSSICFGLSMSGAVVPSIPFILQILKGKRKHEEDIELHCVVSGFVSASFSLGAFIGPILGGILVDHLKFPLATTVHAFLFLLMAVITSITSVVDRCVEQPVDDGQPIELSDRVIDISHITSIINN